MYQPVMSKIRLAAPNLKRKTYLSNLEYCNYIATREGVDLTNTTMDQDYARYMDKRPHSHGLFGNIETEDINNVMDEIGTVSKQGKLVYRGILSLHEIDARELGFYEKKNWAYLLEKTLPDIAAEFDISIKTLHWVAAYHQEEKHPHVHYLLWDTADKVYAPFIHVSKQHKCRQIFSREVFSIERSQAVLNKTAARDLILEQGRNILNMAEDLAYDLHYPEAYGMDRIHNTTDTGPTIIPEGITEKLDILSRSLPSSGRMLYAYMPANVKEMIDDISNTALKSDPLSKAYQQFLDNMDLMSDTASVSADKHKVIIDKADKDLRKRTGNMILRSAVNIQKKRDNMAAAFKVPPSCPFEEPDITAFGEEGSAYVPTAQDTTKETIEQPDIHDLLLDNLEFIDHHEPIQITGEPPVKNIPVPENNQSISPFEPKRRSSPDSSRAQTEGDKKQGAPNPNKIWTDQYIRAKQLYRGNKNTPKDHTAALKLYLNEADTNNPLALYDIAKWKKDGLEEEMKIQLEKDYYKLALDAFLKLGNENAYIQYRVGKMYSHGEGTKQDHIKAACHFTNAANAHNKYAQYSIGISYKYGRGVDTNLNKALEYLLMSSKQGNILASYEAAKLFESLDKDGKHKKEVESLYTTAYSGFLAELKNENKQDYSMDQLLNYRIGKMLMDGKGVEKDLNIAVSYLEKSAELGSHDAEFALGQIYLDKSYVHYDIQKALSYLSEAVKGGQSYTQYSLGRLYSKKDTELYDLEKALYWYGESAKQGNEFAQYALGKLFMDKDNVMFDYKKAASLLEGLAKKGNDSAQFSLSKLYMNEESSLYDFDKGIAYLKESAELDNQYAQYTLGKIHLSEKYGMYDLSRAVQLFIRSGDKGTDFSFYQLGLIYTNKNNEIYDLDTGIHYLMKAIDKNNTYAMVAMGKIFLDNTTDKFNLGKAVSWLSLASNNENTNGTCSLGRIYSDKKYGIYDIQKAIRLFEEAAENKDSYAQFFLGMIYLTGNGVKRDINKAEKYLKEAQENGNKIAGEILENWRSMTASSLLTGAIKMIGQIGSSLTENSQQQGLYEELKKYKSRSKQASKEETVKDRDSKHEQSRTM